MRKRVTSTLGLLGALALVVLATSACAPEHNPNNPGPPTVVKALAFYPDDPTVQSMLYLTDDPTFMAACPDFDFDAGAGAMDAYTGTGWGFRIVMSELIGNPDEVEPIGDSGVGEQIIPGFVQITTPEGGTVTSTLDPTLQLTPDMLYTIYQPSGGSGCFGTIDVPEPSTGGSTAAPAFVTSLGVPSLPSNTELTLWLKKDNEGVTIVDTGDTAMAADFSVNFTTDPMLVDCPDITACNTLPYVDAASQPQDPADPDVGFDMVSVQFNTTIGDPAGVYLFEMTGDPATATLVPDVIADVDSNIPGSLWGEMPNAVSLTMGIDPDTESYIGIVSSACSLTGDCNFTPGATYWIVVTDAVKDLWGMPAVVTDVVDENGDPMDLCGDATAAGVTLPTGETCIWAGSFSIVEAA
jgi:hypothetical protein